ncbi:hypothetical protein FHX42_004194 [Saccharopolyspora lacisalsi]|uniref:PrpF, AcnD-accessory n=1 Tax=Halosaccharopolyspora lacisalsi TaxID=1000566 RepID=A0A839E4R4_9PSEU|nr:PrpF domain-containing protein [Halosaccharopolyspora lacisalsi]MBA8826815.1 hypothetical protein [Halosaccharopolyspora lacisalsi]
MFVPATLVRGGTSKCWLFDSRDVPATREKLADMLVAVYDAEDPSQVDGVGGATPTTSKAAVAGPSDVAGVDVDYLFAQVGIGVRRVEWASNCGNCATAIALWAVARGVVRPDGDRTPVVLRNINTGTVLEADVDTTGDEIHWFGDHTVPGTRSGGVGVGLTFIDPIGATTGKVTPTGHNIDMLDLEGTAVPATLVDAGAPVALADGRALGATGTETLADVEALVEPLRRIRRQAASHMGLGDSGVPPADSVPKVGIVGPPTDYTTELAEPVAASDYDVAVRMLSMTAPHPAIGLTSAVAVAVAHLLEGSLIHTASTTAGTPVLRIGTPSGVVTVRCEDVNPAGPRRVTVARAARVLADAQILVPNLLAKPA